MRSIKHILSFSLMLAIAGSGANAYIVHKVKRGESVTGIAKKYGVSVDDIIALNPEANSGLAHVKTLMIPDGSDNPSQPDGNDNGQDKKDSDHGGENNKDKDNKNKDKNPKPGKDEKGNKIAPPDNSKPVINPRDNMIYTTTSADRTMVDVSHRTGIDIHRLIDLNPFLDPDKLSPGTQVRLSDRAPLLVENTIINNDDNDDSAELVLPQDLITQNNNVIDEDDQDIILADNDEDPDAEQTVLIALPFMSADGTQSRSALLVTDFYKGFLLGVNDSDGSNDRPLRLIVDDTTNSAGVLSSQLAEYRYDGLSMVIAPEESSQLNVAADYGQHAGVYVFNVFNVKDESYLTNPYMIQCNTPQSVMYDKVLDMLLSDYAGYTPVILDPAEAKAEKQSFVEALRVRYHSNNLDVIELPFSHNLSVNDLSDLDPAGNYIFIPQSGAQNVLSRFANGLSDYQQTLADASQVQLLGYPDWITYRGDNMRALQSLGAIYYSRINYDANQSEAQDVAHQFEHWYGSQMISAMPNQGLIGYDIASMLLEIVNNGSIDSVISGDNFSFDGIQQSFRLQRVPDGGMVNTAVYIITYNTDGSVNVRII